MTLNCFVDLITSMLRSCRAILAGWKIFTRSKLCSLGSARKFTFFLSGLPLSTHETVKLGNKILQMSAALHDQDWFHLKACSFMHYCSFSPHKGFSLSGLLVVSRISRTKLGGRVGSFFFLLLWCQLPGWENDKGSGSAFKTKLKENL